MKLWTSLLFVEIVKLHSRASARVGLVLLAALGVAGPIGLEFLAGAGITLNGGDLGASLDLSAPNAVRWSLILRNFFVAQAFLLLLASQSFAAELQTRTLRDDLIRPVPRAFVLLAKWCSLATWSFLALAAQWTVSSVVGLLLHPSTGQAAWSDVLLGYGAAFVADASFAAVALAMSVATRSVAGGIVAMFLFLVIERFVGTAIWAASGMLSGLPPEFGTVPPFVLTVLELGPWLPSSAWGAWRTLLDGVDPIWYPWVALVIWTTLAVGSAERLFARMDLP